MFIDVFTSPVSNLPLVQIFKRESILVVSVCGLTDLCLENVQRALSTSREELQNSMANLQDVQQQLSSSKVCVVSPHFTLITYILLWFYLVFCFQGF